MHIEKCSTYSRSIVCAAHSSVDVAAEHTTSASHSTFFSSQSPLSSTYPLLLRSTLDQTRPGWVGLGCLCLSSLCRSRHFACTQPIGSLAPLNLHAASLPSPLPPTPSPSTKNPAPSVQGPVLLAPGQSCSLCDCCVREGLRLLAGIPPQLSGRLLCRLLVLCLACCNIISTRFCRPDHCDLSTSAPAKAATKHKPQRSNTPARSNHPSSIGRLAPPPPPAREGPPAAPSTLHPPPSTSPPATIVQGVPCQQSLPRAFQNLSLFGAATALPHPGVACPVGLVLLVRSRLAFIAWPCSS